MVLKWKLSYGLGRKRIPNVEVIVCPNTCSVTGVLFEYVKTDGPK